MMKCYRRPGAPAIAFTPRCQPSSGCSRFWPLSCAGVSPPRRRYVHSTGQTAAPAPGTPIHPGPHPSPLLRWALSPLKRRTLPHHRGQPTPSSTLLRWTPRSCPISHKSPTQHLPCPTRRESCSTHRKTPIPPLPCPIDRTGPTTSTLPWPLPCSAQRTGPTRP